MRLLDTSIDARAAMPRRLVCIATALLLLTGCPHGDRDTALPWHGPLTRVMWADLATGRFAMPSCGTVARDGESHRGPAVRILSQLTTSEAFNCVALSPDSLHQYAILGEDGAVELYSTIIYEPPREASRIDSVHRALDALYGPGQRCRLGFFGESIPAIGAVWRAPGYAIWLSPGMPGHGPGWRSDYRAVLIHREAGHGGCPPGDEIPDDGRPLGTRLPPPH